MSIHGIGYNQRAKALTHVAPTKCDEFVADVVEESGRPRPQVKKSGILGWVGFKRDATANELTDPNVNIPGWSKPGPVSGAAPGTSSHNNMGNGAMPE